MRDGEQRIQHVGIRKTGELLWCFVPIVAWQPPQVERHGLNRTLGGGFTVEGVTSLLDVVVHTSGDEHYEFPYVDVLFDEELIEEFDGAFVFERAIMVGHPSAQTRIETEFVSRTARLTNASVALPR